MTEAVVGTSGIIGVGLGNGCNGYGNNRDEGVYELLGAVDRSNQTQGILAAVRHETNANREAVQANAVAIEKTAAANILAIEKTAAAAALAQAQCCCDTKELIREENQKTRDLINETEKARLVSLLADCKNELLIVRLGGTTTTGAVAKV